MAYEMRDGTVQMEHTENYILLCRIHKILKGKSQNWVALQHMGKLSVHDKARQNW